MAAGRTRNCSGAPAQSSARMPLSPATKWPSNRWPAQGRPVVGHADDDVDCATGNPEGYGLENVNGVRDVKGSMLWLMSTTGVVGPDAATAL
jgi:hypothetical protein